MEKLLTMNDLTGHRATPRRQASRGIIPYTKPTIYKMMEDGQFPKPIRLGERRVAWRESDILEWLDKRGGAGE